MKLCSPVFSHNGLIPKKYTCQGLDMNPPLEILEPPKEVKAFALIMDDPDVPKSVREDGMWVHWLFWNLDPETLYIEENSILDCPVGQNTGGENRYMGPCPPDREHRYFFKLYALDQKISLARGATKEQLLEEIEGKVLAHAELMGRYEKIYSQTD